MRILSSTYRVLATTVLLALALMPVTIALAQSGGEPGDTDAQDAAPALPYGPKPDQWINLEDGQVKDAAAPEAPAAEVVSPTATWHVIENQGFEGVWPSTGWGTWDYNGSTGGLYTWNDVNVRAFAGSWSAFPSNSQINSIPTFPYVNNLHSIMVYGPFSLVGATNAKVTFNYWLDTEQIFDFLGYGYSCDFGRTWTDTSVSGSNNWKAATLSIKKCINKTAVLVRWTFISDNTAGLEGAYVDNVKIQSYY